MEDEIIKQKENLEAVKGVKSVRGWRNPYLVTGNNTFRVLADNNFLYDSSLPTTKGQRWWPYTMKYLSPNYPDRCASPPCRKSECLRI